MKQLFLACCIALLPLLLSADEIHWAARKNQVGTIKKLLKRNPNLVHERDLRKKRTPLHVAAEHGSLQSAEILIGANANVNAVTKREGTPLDVAAEHGQSEIAELLLKHGAEADAFTYAALGQTDKALAVDDVNARDENGFTLIYHATSNGHGETVRRLLEKKADPELSPGDELTPLELAVLDSHEEMVKLLLAGGADPLYRNPNGQNMLHLCITPGMATIFLAFEADTNLADYNGITPLQAAIPTRNLDLIKLLLDFGALAKVADKTGETPLHIAARYDHAPITALLLKHKADVNAATTDGNTPLHYCSKSRAHPQQVPPLLLKHGAEVNPLNKAGKTPLDLEEEAIQQWIGIGLDEDLLGKIHATANLLIKHGGKNGVQLK